MLTDALSNQIQYEIEVVLFCSWLTILFLIEILKNQVNRRHKVTRYKINNSNPMVSHVLPIIN